MDTPRTFSQMQKLLSLYITLLLCSAFSSCYVARVNTTALLTKGDRDVSKSKKYWQEIERGSLLSVISCISANKAEQGHYDYIAFPGAGGEAELEEGIIIKLDTVHYKSGGYVSWDTDYIGTILEGDLSGSKIRVNNILEPIEHRSEILKLDSRYLKKIR